MDGALLVMESISLSQWELGISRLKMGLSVELKTRRVRATGSSLADAFSNPHASRTPTATAKAVAEIGSALFEHGPGLLHGAVKPGNVRFHADR
jgi:hypothetical protein